jgi:hypothetical protein
MIFSTNRISLACRRRCPGGSGNALERGRRRNQFVGGRCGIVGDRGSSAEAARSSQGPLGGTPDGKDVRWHRCHRPEDWGRSASFGRSGERACADDAPYSQSLQSLLSDAQRSAWVSPFHKGRDYSRSAGAPQQGTRPCAQSLYASLALEFQQNTTPRPNPAAVCTCFFSLIVSHGPHYLGRLASPFLSFSINVHSQR